MLPRDTMRFGPIILEWTGPGDYACKDTEQRSLVGKSFVVSKIKKEEVNEYIVKGDYFGQCTFYGLGITKHTAPGNWKNESKVWRENKRKELQGRVNSVLVELDKLDMLDELEEWVTPIG